MSKSWTEIRKAGPQKVSLIWASTSRILWCPKCKGRHPVLTQPRPHGIISLRCSKCAKRLGTAWKERISPDASRDSREPVRRTLSGRFAG